MSFFERIKLELHRGWFLFYRELQFRAKLTFFGYGWNIVNSLAAAIPLIFVGKQFNFGGSESHLPYEVHALLGVLFWGVFWDAVITPMDVAFKTRQLLKRVPIGNMTMISATAWAILINFIVKFVLVAIVMVIFGVWFNFSFVLSLMYLPILMLMGLSVGLPFMSVGTVYQDVRYAVGFLGQALMWSAPILYETPKEGILHTLNLYNPLTYLISAPRNWTVSTHVQHAPEVLASTLFALLAFGLGFAFYRSSRKAALDYVV